MSPELTQKLMDSYPLLYSEKNVPRIYSKIHDGFRFDDGWYNLVDQLSLELERLNHEGHKIRAVGMKEKFGTLRFITEIYDTPKYTRKSRKAIWDLIMKAEADSANICEVCGKSPAKISGTKWLKTTCEEHIRVD